jgi:hypothetical protein
MRASLSITSYSWPPGPARLAAELARVVRYAEEAGLDMVWAASCVSTPTSTPSPGGSAPDRRSALKAAAQRDHGVPESA